MQSPTTIIKECQKSQQANHRTVGPWKLGRTIGKGCSGRVKLARHVKTGQLAAVKIISKIALLQSRMSLVKSVAEAERVKQSVEREIVIMKLIEHPNVMTLYDVWETSAELYLVMEYVEGGELFDYIIQRGRLEVTDALNYFQQIISAVKYCHGFNIAHRDLKPENILIDKAGNIKVADFGMAAWEAGGNLLKTSCGSPHYAAPEIVEGRCYRGAMSDIWSCGVILYALLGSRLPFDDENVRILLEKVKRAEFVMLTDIPECAKDLITRMLVKNAEERITMDRIVAHPFMTMQPPRTSEAAMICQPVNHSTVRPIERVSDIDGDVFGNLQVLWNNCSDQTIICALMSEQSNWEKVVYDLLLQHKSKRVKGSNFCKLQYSRSEGDKGKSKSPEGLEVPQPEPPTPGEAAGHRREPAEWLSVIDNAEQSLSILVSEPAEFSMQAHTGLSTDLPSPPAKADLDPGAAHRDTVNTSKPAYNSPEILRPLRVPEFGDEAMQRFFQQIVDRLNVLQAHTPHIDRTLIDPSYSADPRFTQQHTPRLQSVMESCLLSGQPFLHPLNEHSHQHNTQHYGLGILDDIEDMLVPPQPSSATVRSNILPPASLGRDKENIPISAAGRHTASARTKTSSAENRLPLAERHLRRLQPLAENMSTKKSSWLGTPVTPRTSPAQSDVVFSSGRHWLTSILKFQPTTFEFLSVLARPAVQERYTHVLAALGCIQGISHFHNMTTLKCRLDKMCDKYRLLGDSKVLRFRIQLRDANQRQTAAGFDTEVTVVREKGASFAFKSLCNNLHGESQNRRLEAIESGKAM